MQIKTSENNNNSTNGSENGTKTQKEQECMAKFRPKTGACCTVSKTVFEY